MKKRIFKAMTLAVMALATINLSSCSDNENNNGGTQTGGTYDLGDGTSEFEITEDMTLSYPNTYNLSGFVYVTSGVTLTIEPGVIIKGDKDSKATLIVEKGGKLMAEGTADRPIVFTSSKEPGMRNPGDWGGIILLGDAYNNQGDMTIEGGVRSHHGGYDDAHSAGTLKYVRIEFAGIEYSTDNEINSLTLGSVGSGTTLQYIQVSYGGDDSFEWFGGCADAKYLVSYSAWDDDFDTDNGFSGRIQYGVILRNPQIADKSTSNGFESDNCSAGTPVAPYTSPVFANVSIFGPVTNPTTYVESGNVNGSAAGQFQLGVQIRRSSRTSLFNSVIAGFPIGLTIEDDKSGSTAYTSAAAGEGATIISTIMAGTQKNFQNLANNKSYGTSVLNGDDNGADVEALWTGWGNATPLATIADLDLQGDPQNLTSPNFCPNSTSVLASGASWTDSKVQDSYFDKVSYRGAFSSTETADSNWMTGWTNFDPQNTVY